MPGEVRVRQRALEPLAQRSVTDERETVARAALAQLAIHVHQIRQVFLLDQAADEQHERRLLGYAQLTAQRAEERIGERVEVLLTEDLSLEEGPGVWLGHAAHQDPDADGTTTVAGVPGDAVPGQLVAAEVVGTEGVDLVARALVPAVVPTGR